VGENRDVILSEATDLLFPLFTGIAVGSGEFYASFTHPEPLATRQARVSSESLGGA
jgi:hypothetical protein